MVAACISQGAMAAAMSGSGSAVFGVFAEAVAPRAVAKLQRADWLVTLTRTFSRREATRRIGL
jgi:4-diphosphocytidyl-2C-methyl-D-erythritol kinase